MEKDLKIIEDSLKRYESYKQFVVDNALNLCDLDRPLIYKKDFIIGKIVVYHNNRTININESIDNLRIKIWKRLEGAHMYDREITFRYFSQVLKSELDKIRKYFSSKEDQIEPTERKRLGVLEYLGVMDEFKDSDIILPNFKSIKINKEIFEKYDQYIHEALSVICFKKVAKVAIKTHDHSKLCLIALKKILITMIKNDQSFNRVLALDLENLVYAVYLHDCVKIYRNKDELETMDHADKRMVKDILSKIYKDEIDIECISDYISTHSSKNPKLYSSMLIEQRIIIDADILSKVCVEGVLLVFKHKRSYERNIALYKAKRLSKDVYNRMTSKETKRLFEEMKNTVNSLIPDTLSF